MQKFATEYNTEEWIFLLHNDNGNTYLSIPLAHSAYHKETHENLKTVLELIGYARDNWLIWLICGDLKILCMVLGQQQGYTIYPCFLCEWDSRARHLH
ncbi:hypothetical protein PR048_015454 [Dryococelus australis]|uniref:Uncharacterized protein n=1 Tax=Dryococelus australis TaxID=614101 RepID=A0ABQ9HH58_9NEOP|nr:hypothetical protein PR048_015454 [Dryococelus australis]